MDVPGFTDAKGEAKVLGFAHLNRDETLDIVRAGNRSDFASSLYWNNVLSTAQAIEVSSPDGSEGRANSMPEM